MQLHQACPSPQELRQLLDESLTADEQARLTGHLDSCEACQQALETLAAGCKSWAGAAEQLRESPPPDAALDRVVNELRREVTEETEGFPDDCSEDHELPLGLLSPPEKDGELGRLGPYEVSEVIGRGGMGIVLKAFDPRLQRYVAIKVMSPHVASSAAARKRFRREAQAAAAVSHEHVIAIHDVNIANGFPYLVMEYVPGKSLQERISEQGPLELKEILRIGLQAAQGLAAAHAQGLIHRDIKPANILLENCVARVKITDFGLARTVDDASLTQSGVLPGTPQYMAPEQASGEPLDHRADLFSLGSVLYAMCTGRPPFRASTTMAVLRRVAEDTPKRASEVNPDVPAWLGEVIAKLHAKDPRNRFQSAGEVAECLSRHLARLQQPNLSRTNEMPGERASIPLSRNRTRRRLIIAAAALLFCVGGLSVTDAMGMTELADYVASILRIRTPEGTLVVEVDDPNVKVSVDSDGQDLVITGTGAHEFRLRTGQHQVRATKGGVELQNEIVTITRGGKQIVKVSREAAPTARTDVAGPNDRLVITTLSDRDGKVRYRLRSVPPDGAEAATKAEETADIILEVSPDVNYDSVYDLADKIRNLRVERVPGTTRDRAAISGKLLIRPLPLESASSGRALEGHKGRVRAVTFSPDGKFLATAGDDNQLRLWSSPGYRIVWAGPVEGRVISTAFFRDGKTLATVSEDGAIRLFESATGKGQATLRDGAWLGSRIAFDSQGKLVASVGNDRTIRLWDLTTGKEVRSLSQPVEQLEALALSGDGQRLATSGGDGTVRIWDATSGRELIVLKGHEAPAQSIAFAPDGRLLVASDADKTLRVLDATTGEQISAVRGAGSEVTCAAFSPDGKTLITGHADGTIRVWDASTLAPLPARQEQPAPVQQKKP